MAKNRFNMFLRIKHVGAVSIDGFEEYFESDDISDSNILEENEITELNYSISRLSAINRQVIILYYLQEMKTQDIARLLSIPEGTIKRRLFDAKKDIKKGIESMTNVGISSYAPAELDIWGGYSIPNYWDNISDIMTKQIFVVCS